MTIQEAQLIKRTAWRNMQPRTPSKEDEKYVPTAIRMLSYIGALNYALLDLETELLHGGRFRHAAKHAVVQSQSLVAATHDEAFKMLRRISGIASMQYNDAVDKTYAEIDDVVLLSGVEKSYNIVVALCRLIERLNRALSGRYDFAPARPLYRIPSLLSVLGERDYEIDSIIEVSQNN